MTSFLKKLSLFMICILPCWGWAQHADAEKVCEADNYYDWHEVEVAFSKEVNIPFYECRDFFNYAYSNGYLSIQEYHDLFEKGKITRKNALKYWLKQIPEFKKVYQNNYLPYLESKKKQIAERARQNGANRVDNSCYNLDFSSGTLTNWSGQWDQGTYMAGGQQIYGPLNATGLNSYGLNDMGYVHEVCTQHVDRNVPLNAVPPGHTYSVRLGDDSAYQQTSYGMFPYNHQTISNTFSVTQSNKTITYWYAVALSQNLQNPHNAQQVPYLRIRMYDNNGNEIICARYDVNAVTAPNIGGFQSMTSPDGYSTFLYKDWSSVLIPLINYVGQNITIEFETCDCSLGGHFGYAYLTVDCAPFSGILSNPVPCSPNKVLTAPSGVATYSWTGPGIVGPANTQNVTVNTSGTYTVTMTTLGNSGYTCTFSIDTNITLTNPMPIPSFSATTVCAGGTTQFTDTSNPNGNTISGWSWNFGDGGTSTTHNPSHSYASAGTYSATLTLTTSNNCTVSTTNTVLVNAIPVASFSAPNVCVGNPAPFSNTSTGGGSYNWTFGDGGTSASQNPNHTYANSGTYNVSLTVTATGGACSDTYSSSVTVLPSPTVSFSGTSVCIGFNTVFSNNSSGAVSYSWNFGDGSGTSIQQAPTYLYGSAGNYNVILSASGSNGCTAKDTNQVTVYPLPVVNFTNTPPCLGQVTTFSNTSTPTGLNFGWNFGDPLTTADTSNIANPTYSYGNLGTYSVVLTATSSVGCTSSVTHTISPSPIPSLTVSTPAPFCSGDLVPSASYTVNPNDPAVTYTWTNNNTAIGLGAGSTHIPPAFTAASNTTTTNIDGIITITPELNGCIGPPATETISIKPTPVVNHPNVNYCPDTATAIISFISTPSVPSGNITWNDASINSIGLSTSQGMGSIPSFNTIDPGFYAQSNVISIQASLNGCTGPASNFTITVNPFPVASFTYSNACDGTPTQFTDLSSIGTGAVTQWNWDMNNDGVYTDDYAQNPQYLLNPAGYYTVNLIVISDKGCRSSTTNTVYVNPSPVVSFSADSTGCQPLTTSFIAVATVPAPQTINDNSWVWNLGNDAISNTPVGPVSATYTNSSHTQSAYYTVSLQVASSAGCTTNVIKNNYITVYPQPKADFTWTPQDVDIIEPTVYFHSQAIGATHYWWDFGDIYLSGEGNTNYDTLVNPKHTYSDQIPYTYSVTQTVSNSYGCKDSIVKEVIVKPVYTFYIPNAFSPNNDGRNEGFKGTGIGIDNSTYNLWIFDRWGNEIFHATDLERAWDGKVHGEPVQEDTYVWKVSFMDVFENPHQFAGIVTLIK